MTAAATGRRHGALVLLLSLALAGCATSAIELAPERPDRPWVPATADNGDIVPGKAGTGPSAGGYVLPPQRGLGYVPPAAAIVTRKTYRLGELIDIAQSSNPTTRIAWNEARRAALAAGIAESTFLPRISAGAIGGIQTSNGSALALGREATSNETLSGSVSAVSLEWLLFDFGQRAAVVDAAKQLSLISNFGFTAAHQQAIYNVSLAFYGHAAARSRVAAARQSLKNAESVQAAVEDRYRHQIGTVTEVANVRQLTAQARLAVVQSSGSVEDSYLTLVTAMGISPLTRIKIADIAGRRLSPAMAAPLQSVISAALARRPDIQSAYAAQKASLANVRVAEADFLPKVFLSGNGTYNSGSLSVTAIPAVGQLPPTVNINGNHLGGTVLAGVTVPLYDGGFRLAKLAGAGGSGHRGRPDGPAAQRCGPPDRGGGQRAAHRPLDLCRRAGLDCGCADVVRRVAGGVSRRHRLHHGANAGPNPAFAGQECIDRRLQPVAFGGGHARAVNGRAGHHATAIIRNGDPDRSHR